MQTAICSQPLIPMRIEPSECSEQVTQILFGEPFIVLENRPKWCKVRLLTDGYEGWIDAKTANIQIQEAEDFRVWPKINVPMAKGINTKTQLSIYLPFGALLPNFDPIETTVTIGFDTYSLNEDEISTSNEMTISEVLTNAYKLLNAPYLWGGKTIMGIDCSGFSQMVYRLSNYWLPRDASQQISHGEIIEFIQETIPGDLVFFDNEAGKITHVGMIINNTTIIHASGKVRIDTIDQQGIFNKELNKYTHHLRLIKRLTLD